MDTISAYLDGIRLQNFEAGLAETRAPWGVKMPGNTWDIVFYFMTGAPSIIRLPVPSQSFRLTNHSVCLILNSQEHIVQDEGRTPPNYPTEIKRRDTIDKFRFKTLGNSGGAPTSVYYMGLDMGGCGNNPLLTALPSILITKFDDTPAWLSTGINWLRDELLSELPARHAIGTRLGELLLIGAVRAYVMRSRDAVPAWLRPTNDLKLRRVLSLLHTDIAHEWTLEELARQSGTSRSRLISRANAELGEGIFQYLKRWRMYEASRLLRETSFDVSRVARLVGYQSEAAFATAFGRTVGVSPRDYRRQVKTTNGSTAEG